MGSLESAREGNQSHGHADIFMTLKDELEALITEPLAPSVALVNKCCYNAHTVTVPVAAGSLYVLAGDARYLYRYVQSHDIIFPCNISYCTPEIVFSRFSRSFLSDTS